MGRALSPVVCGRRVCSGPCGRWRPIVDFEYVVYRRDLPGERVYVRSICWLCQKRRHAEGYVAARVDARAAERLRRASTRRATAWRRERGVAPRELTGLKDRSAQSRESKRKARRRAGIPERTKRRSR